jgi:hypothetical protein
MAVALALLATILHHADTLLFFLTSTRARSSRSTAALLLLASFRKRSASDPVCVCSLVARLLLIAQPSVHVSVLLFACTLSWFPSCGAGAATACPSSMLAVTLPLRAQIASYPARLFICKPLSMLLPAAQGHAWLATQNWAKISRILDNIYAFLEAQGVTAVSMIGFCWGVW